MFLSCLGQHETPFLAKNRQFQTLLRKNLPDTFCDFDIESTQEYNISTTTSYISPARIQQKNILVHSTIKNGTTRKPSTYQNNSHTIFPTRFVAAQAKHAALEQLLSMGES